jgi:hypothetical protein
VACSAFLIPSSGDVGAAWAYLIPVAAMSVTAGALLLRRATAPSTASKP